jgi:hypothetical protein
MLAAAPILLVNTVGIVLAVVYWRRHPHASVLLVLGLGVLIIVPVIDIVVSTLGYPWLFRNARSATVRTVLSVIRVFWSILTAAGYGLLVSAVLADRRKSARS